MLNIHQTEGLASLLEIVIENGNTLEHENEMLIYIVASLRLHNATMAGIDIDRAVRQQWQAHHLYP